MSWWCSPPRSSTGRPSTVPTVPETHACKRGANGRVETGTAHGRASSMPKSSRMHGFGIPRRRPVRRRVARPSTGTGGIRFAGPSPRGRVSAAPRRTPAREGANERRHPRGRAGKTGQWATTGPRRRRCARPRKNRAPAPAGREWRSTAPGGHATPAIGCGHRVGSDKMSRSGRPRAARRGSPRDGSMVNQVVGAGFARPAGRRGAVAGPRRADRAGGRSCPTRVLK
jgi:hypothetical protein